MRVYLFMLLLLIFSFCKNSNTKSSESSLKKDKIPYGYLYEYKGLYNKFSMVDCPDFVRFLNDDKYYVLNDCGIMGDPRIDTISETGKYNYFKRSNKLSFFDRKIMNRGSEGFFDTDLDTIHLEVVRISEDTLVFKENKILIYFSKYKK